MRGGYSLKIRDSGISSPGSSGVVNTSLFSSDNSAGDYSDFRLSPDERSIAFTRGEGASRDIWTFEMARGVPSRITFDAGIDNLPIWSPDSLRILWLPAIVV